MKHGKEEAGFTLIEAVAAWTILLIAVTIFLKCMVMAQSSLAKGAALREGYAAALLQVEAGLEPDSRKKTELKFRMDGADMAMEAEILEYGAENENGDGSGDSAVFKVLVPVIKAEE